MVPRLVPFFLTLSLSFTATLCANRLHDIHERFFSQSLVRGVYGRIFEYKQTPDSEPCAQRITHMSSGFQNPASSFSWLVPHNSIRHDYSTCNVGGALLLRKYDKNNSSKTARKLEHRIARETFRILRRRTTGFWMGVDARRCGRSRLPFPTYLFFVQETDTAIMTPFRVSLAPDTKYLFVISKSFTCVYGGSGTYPVPSSSPTPTPFISPQNATASPSVSPEITPEKNESGRPPSASPSVSSSLHPSTSPSSSDKPLVGTGGQALCFPADATVQLSNGKVREMKDLKVGDVVSVGSGITSTVFTFSHYDLQIRAKFVGIYTTCGPRIWVTAGHMLYVNGALRPAGRARIGDSLMLANGSLCSVGDVRSRIGNGLINPHTLHGDIVVDGVVTSSYTTFVRPSSAHGLLAPVRAAWNLIVRGKVQWRMKVLPRVKLMALHFESFSLHFSDV